MQFSNVFTVLALAMTAAALPAVENVDVVARTNSNPNPPSTCNNNQKNVCCNSVLGILGCAVNVLGGSCTGSSYCCTTDAPVVSST